LLYEPDESIPRKKYKKINQDDVGNVSDYKLRSPHLILSTAGLSEVSDRRQFSMNGTTIKPTIVEFTDRPLGILLAIKLFTSTAYGMLICAIKPTYYQILLGVDMVLTYCYRPTPKLSISLQRISSAKLLL